MIKLTFSVALSVAVGCLASATFVSSMLPLISVFEHPAR